jgi:DNA-binding MarR family transcriptional regulator
VPEKEEPAMPTRDEYRRAAELRGALRRFLRRSDELTRRHGLTTQRYELLLMAKTPESGSSRVTLSELARRLSLAPSSTTELVARAETLGLVRRELDPSNRRAVYVALTEEGERRLAAAVSELVAERVRLTEIVSHLDRDAR